MPLHPLTAPELTALLLNPFYAIQIAPALAAEHEPIVSKEVWIQANVKRIKKMGARGYLTQLLEVLEEK